MEKWCCYRGNIQHTGSLSGKPAIHGNLLWKCNINEEISYSPVLEDNILYTVTDKNLYAINTEKGEILWHYPSKRPSSPVIVDSYIYLCSEDGKVSSLDAKKGNEKWTYKTGGEIKTSPVLAGENLYTGSTDKKFYSLDVQRGKEQWVFKAENEILSSPVVFGNLAFFGSGKVFYAIDIRKGKERWSYRTKSDILSSPSIYSGVIYLSATYLYALDVINGARKWITEIEGDAVTDTPAVTDMSVFILSKTYMQEVAMTAAVLYSIDAIQGNRQWAFFAWNSISSPAIVDNYIYIGAGDGKIYALDTRNGIQKWSCYIDTKSFAPPVAGNGCVYFGGNDGQIYAIE